MIACYSCGCGEQQGRERCATHGLGRVEPEVICRCDAYRTEFCKSHFGKKVEVSNEKTGMPQMRHEKESA